MTARALGVDVGTVRVGLAVCDPLGMVATPYDTVPAGDSPVELAARLVEIARAESCETVVVGLPRALSGRSTASTHMAHEIADALTGAGCRVVLWDERLSSKSAERTLLATGASRATRKAVTDRIAAAVILQGWLDAGQPTD